MTMPTNPPDLPDIDNDLYQSLLNDISARGLLVPILRDAATGEILDGRIRMRICEQLRIKDIPTIYLSRLTDQDRADIRVSANLYRRHLTRAQLRALVEWAVRVSPEDSDRAIAGRCGVDHSTVGSARKRMHAGGEIRHLPATRTGRDGKHYPSAKPAVYTTNRANGTVVRQALQDLGDAAPPQPMTTRKLRVLARRKQRAEQDQEDAAVVLPPDYRVECLDFRLHRAPLGGVALCYGDPPWMDDWERNRLDYAKCVYHCLKPGGFLACYCGQANLYEWMSVLVEVGLKYKWLIAGVNADGGGATRHNGTVRSAWRPIALYQRPGRPFQTPKMLVDVFKTDQREKDSHDWQQPLSEAIELVRVLSRPGDQVADLTAGSGTSGAACALIGGRRYYGAEIDPSCCRTARRRILAALAPSSKEKTG